MKATLFDRGVFEIFVKPGEVVEVRIPKVYGKSVAWGNGFAKGVVSGYFDDHQAFCDAVKHADKYTHSGIYFSLQVIDPRLIGRAFNRLKPSDLTTSDNNVIAYRWLPIDIDPLRPAGVSASDNELEQSLQLRDEVAARIIKKLKFPEPIKAVSGNGGHLLFKLDDMPVSDQSKGFIKDTLDGVSGACDTETVKIDVKVFNPARIWKLYGTTARKGDNIPAGKYRQARPHRMAFIDCLGEFNAHI